MSVKISSNKKDELSVLTLVRLHPLVTLKIKTDDDVIYINIYNDFLPDIKKFVDRAIDEKRDFSVLLSADLRLRHNFSF